MKYVIMACRVKKKSGINNWNDGGVFPFSIIQVETQVIISEIPLSAAVYDNLELPSFSL